MWVLRNPSIHPIFLLDYDCTHVVAVIEAVASLNETFNGLRVPLIFMNSYATHEVVVVDDDDDVVVDVDVVVV